MRLIFSLTLITLSFFGFAQVNFSNTLATIDVVRELDNFGDNDAFFGGCAAGAFDETGTFVVCPDNFVSVHVTGAEFPSSGGYGFNFLPDLGGTGGVPGGFSISGFDTPSTIFNNSLQGGLTNAGYDPMLGPWIIQGFAYTNEADIGGTICQFATNEVSIEFLGPDLSCEGCEAGTISPDQQYVAFDGVGNLNVTGAFVPTGGLGVAWAFSEGSNGTGGIEGGFNITNSIPDYDFDNDLNGLLSSNALPILEGEWLVTGFVYTNPDDAGGSFCDLTETATVYFGTINDCPSIVNGEGSYLPTDLIFLTIVAENGSCCDLWSIDCQSSYDELYYGCRYTAANNYSPLAQVDDDSCEFNCFGDANNDAFIDTFDLLQFLGIYGAACE